MGVSMAPGVLTLLIAIPLAGAAAVAVMDARGERAVRVAALVSAVLTFCVAGWIWIRFSPGTAALQFEEKRDWVPGLGMGYHLGVDGLTVSLVALTAFLFPLALGAAAAQIRGRVKAFQVTALLLEAGLLGTFLAQDLVLFYVFWEAMLIPMYFLIALWGGPARGAAAIKFILYTMAGSVLMLLAIVAVYLQSGGLPEGPTFDLPSLLARPLGLEPPREALLFGAFAVAFAIKMPVWPLHTWLPDAYAEAPPVVTVLLASVMAKAGAYGFVRFCLPLFPDASRSFGPVLSGLAVIGILYGGAVAWTQGDMRRLLAYGSMSHMGFILLGIFALNIPAVQGSLIQMINHGVSTGALFFLAGFLLDRTGRTRTDEYGGIAAAVPALAAATLIVTVSSLALPGTNGFIGEFLILVGTYQADPASPVAAVLATGGIVVAAAYLLAFVGRVFHGPLREDLRGMVDLRAAEYAVLVPLVLVIFWVGFAPQPLLSRSEATVSAILSRVATRSAAPAARPAAGAPPAPVHGLQYRGTSSATHILRDPPLGAGVSP
ncbi:MAG TPA: NADH-quinone oxidoreductase subunit M [bacterium]|nr:NADH-quinone oxidoreductase subunit M [bacterium]